MSVSSRGKIFDWKGRLLKPYRNRNPYLYVHAYSPTLKKTISVNVARAVLMAFQPREDYGGLQADHKDSNPNRNCISNLRWTTRKKNNSRKHARQMKQANHTHTRHPDTILKATRNGETITAENGYRLAQQIGCSHVIIYRILDPDDYATTVFGWRIERIGKEEL